MSRKIVFTKEIILESGVQYIKEFGYNNLNVRSLAKYIGCSTQPIFRIYKNMEEYKKDLKVALHTDYEKFIYNYIDKKDYLQTISYAYALYAKEEPNSFQALFITDLAGSRTVREVIDSPWNRETIENMTTRYNITLEKAEDVYRDTRFYTHGIATQLCCKSIKIENDKLNILIEQMINKLIK